MNPSGEAARAISLTAKLGNEVQELNMERPTLLQQLNHIESPIIDRVPPEILSCIFWFATGLQHSPYLEHRLSDNKTLFRLRAVCSQWHRIVQSSPPFWNTLALGDLYSPARGTDYTILTRRHCQHLGVPAMAVYTSESHSFTPAAIDEVMQVVLKEYPGKIRSLHLERYLNESVWPSILKHAGGDVEFSLLEELELYWLGVGQLQEETSIFRNSPRLRRLKLHGGGGPRVPLEFPWKQITALKLSGTNLEYASQLLPLCPNLVNYGLWYHRENDKPRDALQHRTTSMEFVRNLTMLASCKYISTTGTSKGPEPPNPEFFTRFQFPAVRNLKWYAPLPSNAPSVREFFSNMQVEKLSFSPSVSQYCIDHHLDAFCNLARLKARFVGEEAVVTQWLYRLTIKPGNNNLFPRLQRLHLTVDESHPPHALMVVVHSRRNGPVDWTSLEQDPEGLVLSPYDPTSTHWWYHSRLLEFSSKLYDDFMGADWTWSPHYGAMNAMISEAREVEGNFNYGEGRVLF